MDGPLTRCYPDLRRGPTGYVMVVRKTTEEGA